MAATSPVRRLDFADAEAFVALRRESLELAPLAFGSSPGDDRVSRLEIARGVGLGRRLLEAAIEQARTWGLRPVHLSVTETAVEARGLYESAGFRLWGTEPGSFLWQGQLVDEHHLVLRLDEST